MKEDGGRGINDYRNVSVDVPGKGGGGGGINDCRNVLVDVP
jgi:hypothetical protein